MSRSAAPSQNQNQRGTTALGPGASHSQDLTSLIGYPLRLTLSNNSIVTGSLWAYDSNAGTLALETGVQQPSVPIPSHAAASPSPTILNPTSSASSSTTKSSGFRIIKTREITNVEVITLKKDQEPSRDLQFVKELTPIHPVNVEAAKRREEIAVKEGILRAKRKGKDVSQLGQDVFDALSKTLPCRWHQKHIIVLDEVIISGPNYDTSSTNVPSFTHEQLRRLADNSAESNGTSSTEGKAKANSWTRVIKVLEGERKRILARQAGVGSSPAPSPVPSSSPSVVI